MPYRIPKRIIQTGKNVHQPLRARAVMSNIRLLNPDYEYLFFDDAQVEEFITREFPDYRAVFDSFQYPIQRYDFFRYLAVYRHGGFYFDLDLLLASGLSGLLEHGCVFPFEAITVSHFLRDDLGMDWQLGNYAFGAAPGHAFLEAIIENCVRAQRDANWVQPMMRGTPPLLNDEFFILNSTGPGLISRTLAENRELAKTVTVLFPDDVCDVGNWNRFGEWGIHLADSSWRPKKSFVHLKFSDYCWRWIQHRNVRQAMKLGKSRYHPSRHPAGTGTARDKRTRMPLVSILIPAYNAERLIAETLQSAIDQTWPRKEIIVIDDGSTDRTAEVARRFASQGVTVVSSKNQGAAAARNQAFQLSQGDYIQWLDADDLLAPDKIERQLAALREGDSKRILLCSSWAPFFHRTRRARFVHNSLCQDLTAVEWLLRKMGENLYMQTATWLTSRELAEAAGSWDTRLLSDDDGEFFCRVLLASEGTRFVPEARVFYRTTPTSRLSHVGNSNKKKDALILSMKLHIQYLRSLEDSERVRKACLTYMQNWYWCFYPERPDLVAELQGLAAELQGRLEEPRLRSKYAWIKPVFGWKAAKGAQMVLPQWKASLIRQCDRAMYKLEAREAAARHATRGAGATQED
jgi:glycosyltransferase involved in cell wall biosynthesis